MSLRDFQGEDVELIFKEWESVRSTLYVAATGLGKTKVATAVAKRLLPKRTIFLCHRGELIFQARDAFLREGMECEIEKAELSASTSLFNRTPVVLATVQTLTSGEVDKKRMQRFKPSDFGLLVYDESQHSVAPGNKSIVDYFTSGNPNLKVLGLTATPDRADEEALGQIFETVASERDILFGKDSGWLVDIEQLFVPLEVDWSHIKTTCGDLNSGELAKVMEAEQAVQGVVLPVLEAMARLPRMSLNDIPTDGWEQVLSASRERWRRVIVFTASVNQAEMLSSIFNRAVSGLSVWVCGKTGERERSQVFADFKSGARSILVNCGVTTEGYDNPLVDLIAMARPTKSRSLYCQMLGRGTRVLPGLVEHYDTKEERIAAIKESSKPSLLVMDFVGNSGKHKLISSANILGGNVSDAVVERAVERAKSSAVPVNMTEALKEEEERLKKIMEAARRSEEARKVKLLAKVKYTSQRIDPFSALDVMPPRERGWDSGKVLSPKQTALLLKQGVDPTNIPYAAARALIQEMFRRWRGEFATLKQCAIVKKHYPELQTKNMTRDAASKLITELANNNWRRRQVPA